MSARDDILAAVRGALAGAQAAPRPGASPRAEAPADIVGLFAERVEDYRAVVERCTPTQLLDHVNAALGGADSVVVPSGLGLDVPGAVVDDSLSVSDLDAVDAVVTRARVGIAETGTIVLDHREDQGRRAISLVPDRHVCIVAESQIVHDVPDAMEHLEPRRPQTWISGPSATSDIELTRVEGVHGPRKLHVLIVSEN